MSFQNLCPYGLKSIVECITRATLISQPTDIPDFIYQYLSGLIKFRESLPEADPKDLSFHYQKLWEKKFLRNMKSETETPVTTTETSASSSQVLSQTKVEEAVKMLFTDLASSTEKNVTGKGQSKKRGVRMQTPEKEKKPTANPPYPTPPPRVGRQKNLPPAFLVVKGEGKPAPPPRDGTVETRRVSLVRRPTLPLNNEAKSSTPTEVSAPKSSAVSRPSKLPTMTVPVVTHKLVLPPIPQKRTGGDQVSASATKRDVVQEKSSSRSPARRAGVATKPRPPSVPRPENSKTTTANRRPKVTPEKTQPSTSPERSGGRRVLWERARVKPTMERTVEGIKGTAFTRPGDSDHFNLAQAGSSPHTCPHLAHAVHIIRYKRMQVRSTSLDHGEHSY